MAGLPFCCMTLIFLPQHGSVIATRSLKLAGGANMNHKNRTRSVSGKRDLGAQ